jgi:hypothetical protein
MIRVSSCNLNNLFDRFNFHAQVPESPKVATSFRWRLDDKRDVLAPLSTSNHVQVSYGDKITNNHSNLLTVLSFRRSVKAGYYPHYLQSSKKQPAILTRFHLQNPKFTYRFGV